MPWDQQAQNSLNALWAAVASLHRRFDSFDARLRQLEAFVSVSKYEA